MHRDHRRNVVVRPGFVAAALAGVVLLAVGCGSSESRQKVATRLATNLGEPVAFASPSPGRLLFAERLTGRVRAIVDGRLSNEDIARVDVSTAGQRGLLGMAVDNDGNVFVAYTENFGDRRIIVAKVRGSVEQIVWRGPASQDQANGGHLQFAPSGALIVGIGELAAKQLADSIGPPPERLAAGRLLELDPRGQADQTPKVMSSGWYNPYAFVVRTDGSVWVADNAPNGTPERLARGDRDGKPTEILEFDEELIPTALTVDANNDFVMCTLTGSGVRKQVGQSQFGDSITTSPCTRSAFGLPGTNRLVFSDETSIFELSVA